MPGDQGDIDLGNHGIVVAHDAGEQLLAFEKHAEKISLNFLLDGAGNPAAGAKVAEVVWLGAWRHIRFAKILMMGMQ